MAIRWILSLAANGMLFVPTTALVLQQHPTTAQGRRGQIVALPHQQAMDPPSMLCQRGLCQSDPVATRTTRYTWRSDETTTLFLASLPMEDDENDHNDDLTAGDGSSDTTAQDEEEEEEAPVPDSSSSSSPTLSASQSQRPLYSIDQAIRRRVACKRFLRHDSSSTGDKNETTTTNNTPSTSNPAVVALARYCLDLARLSPSSFNTQPYKLVVVHSPEQKAALAHYGLGPQNGQRVLDSDVTVVFCADKRSLLTAPEFCLWMQNVYDAPKQRPVRLMTLVQWGVLSSAFLPLPRLVAAPLTWMVRAGVGMLDFAMRQWQRLVWLPLQRLFWGQSRLRPTAELPALSSAETWSAKQATMVAMTYMLCCASRGLATIPMEGFNAWGVRNVLNIPQGRYAIPIVVSTGIAATSTKGEEGSSIVDPTTTSDLQQHGEEEEEEDHDAMLERRRYPSSKVIYENVFGTPFSSPDAGVVPA